MLWVMESDGFWLESLQKQTQYRDLVRKVPDEVFLDELAEELTNISTTHKVTRTSLIFSLGNVAVRRRREIEQVMRERIGTMFDWKVVSAGVDFEQASGLGKLMGALLAPLPVVWIRIAI